MKCDSFFTYCMYMAECENQFPEQREASIEAFIQDINNLKSIGEDPNDYIDEILEKYNLRENLLSKAEVNYINAVINA